MKKYLITGITLILAIFIFLIVKTNIDSLQKGDSLQNEDVKKILTEYFSHSLEIQKSLQYSENKSILPGSYLSTYDKLNSKMISTYGQKIEWYKLNLDIKEINKDKDFIKVYVNEIVDFKYADLDDTSGMIEEHIIYINTKQDKLLVERDIYEMDSNPKDIEKGFNSKNGYEEYIQNKIKEKEERFSNMDKILEEEEEKLHNGTSR
ncbi:hypothetical protein CHF27_012070 [Romboutsia maritimum]|uniref:Uncharacterized protein n=1 Tax=Romboutsia maritimum TaxID=2020948 RepID=A0A371IQF2_9FIRM|nr:hypothetical protein [Romboutsia maritimum]RDY22706.1 hypothetical protein CHF27_012070 [Romboutsia maritimum]